MKYDLIISDFDGTFRHRDNTIGEKTLNAVKEFERRGGKFAMCTGRMPSSIRPVLLKAGMGGLYVAYQGSLVAETVSGKILREGGFSKAQALKICKAMQEMGLRIHVYDRDTCFVNYRDDYLQAYEDICGIRSEDRADLYGLIENSQNKIFKLIAMVYKEERNAIRDELKKRLGEEEFYISCSASTLVEVTAKEDTKAAAVEFLGKYYGVANERILAFGDNQNDAPMLQAAGHGVAVANADPALKSVADEVHDKTCDEDAVGDYLERFVL
ncbi:MAG: HAD family phosphatase [Clostridia bacterium]|nr:HAD family phosphatase [Clostridia bacterium]